MLQSMIRLAGAFFGTLLLAARACVLAALGIAFVLCAGYSLYWLVRHGQLPDVSVAGLRPDAYEYLLPPRYIVLNTLYIFCIRLPLPAFLGVLFLLAWLCDRLGRALARWAEAVLRAGKTI